MSFETVFDPLNSGPSDQSLALDDAFATLLASSFRERVGAPSSLLPVGPGAADLLYESAPFCLLAHNAAPDPRFVYANRTAQACFDYDWDAFTRLPSRLSAGPKDRAERQAFIETVRKAGFATGYSGLRVARSGRVFVIEDVTMWQIVDADGALLGEAAVYARWRPA